jgi:hypothetical protein
MSVSAGYIYELSGPDTSTIVNAQSFVDVSLCINGWLNQVGEDQSGFSKTPTILSLTLLYRPGRIALAA